MSATNWAICPSCEKVRRRQPKAKDFYGKVDEAKYRELLAQEQKESKENKYTLREDYELFYDENGRLIIEYGASCQCGEKLEFTLAVKRDEYGHLVIEEKP